MNREFVTGEKNHSLLATLFSYLKKPKYIESYEKINKKKKFFNVFKLWSLSIIVTFFVGLLLSFLMNMTSYDESQHSVVDLFLNYPIIVFMFLAFVWGPVTEELTFRMGLKYSPYRLGFSVAFLMIVFFSSVAISFESINLSIVYYFNKLFDSVGSWALLYYFLFIVFGGLGFGKIFEKKLNKQKVVSFYAKHFPKIFYYSVLFFALVHLFNFEGLSEIWFLSPLLIAPQFILALVLAYIRMFYGLSWAIFVHIMHNFLITAPLLILTRLSGSLSAIMEEGANKELVDISNYDYFIIMSSFSFAIVLFIAIVVSFIILLREYYKARKILKNK